MAASGPSFPSSPGFPSPRTTVRDAGQMLDAVLQAWGGHQDLWIFGYASLIWRPDFEHVEHRMARVHGYHRALKMWSRVNRGTPECPGLVFALLRGGSCQGMVFRIPKSDGETVLRRLWPREMPNAVYDPKWLRCHTHQGDVPGLAFTLSHHSPNFTGELNPAQYRQIFAQARGRFGTTREYAQLTLQHLQALGIRDRALERVFRCADGGLDAMKGAGPASA